MKPKQDSRDVVLPAAAVRRVDELVGLIDSPVSTENDLQNLVVVEHRRESIGTEQESVIRLDIERLNVDFQLGLASQSSRHNVSKRMCTRLLAVDDP